MATLDYRTLLELTPGQTIAFAGSGGLDSCTITSWLTEKGFKVVCFTADLGQPDETDFDDIGRRMKAAGATEWVRVPLQEDLAEAGLKVVQAQAMYEGGYWNTTGIARHVIVRGILPEIKKRGIQVLAHGCTGRGNDQIRFQLVANMLAPEIGLYAPWRDPEYLKKFRGRSEMIDYCLGKKIPITARKDAPYSTDANLLGLTHEAGKLESAETPARFIKSGFGCHPIDAPNQEEVFTIRFDEGRPTAINGRKVSVLEAFNEANLCAGRNGVGIAIHVIENRVVGLKSRGVYEQPGIQLLGQAYEWLVQMVMDRSARELYGALSVRLGAQIYQGLWFDQTSDMAHNAIETVTKLASGTIAVTLYKGTTSFRGASDVKHSIYNEEDTSMEAVGSFDHTDSEGLLRIASLGARAKARGGQVSDRLAKK